MTVVDAMKYILLLFVTFSLQITSGLAYGAQVFSGFLIREGCDFSFTPKNSAITYQVEALNYDVLDSLTRLDNGDFISGSGRFDTAQKKLSIQSIDYVGLQKLLGSWISTDGTIVFKDFSTMRFLPRIRGLNMDAHWKQYQKEFRYSISPKDRNEWALFMSDNMNTSFATVEFTGKFSGEFTKKLAEQKIIMKIFESESGNIVRTLTLERP